MNCTLAYIHLDIHVQRCRIRAQQHRNAKGIVGYHGVARHGVHQALRNMRIKLGWGSVPLIRHMSCTHNEAGRQQTDEGSHTLQSP